MASYAIVDYQDGRVGPARVYYVSRDLRDATEALHDLRSVSELDGPRIELVEIADELAERLLADVTIVG